MSAWLSNHIQSLSLSQEAQEYLQRRMVSVDMCRILGLSSWDSLPDHSSCGTFTRMFGSLGTKLKGMLIVPLLSPRGAVLGFEARSIQEKRIYKYLLPEADWNPLFVGMCQYTVNAIWQSQTVWLTEGVFDMLTLQSVLPASSAVLACGRANLTPKQILFLQRCAKRVFLAYDNDRTGQQGSRQVIKKLNAVKIHATPVMYSGGKDPNEILQRYGFSRFAQYFPTSLQ